MIDYKRTASAPIPVSGPASFSRTRRTSQARRTLAGRVAAGAIAATLGLSLGVPAGGALWGGVTAGGAASFGCRVAYAADAKSTFEDVLDETGKSTDDAPKSELVYALAGPKGDTRAIFVLDGDAASALSAGGGLAGGTAAGASADDSDAGGLAGLDSDDLLDALEDTPFLYQGDLSGEFPWTVSIAYRLDGRAVEPGELKGTTGDVEIDVAVDPLPEGAAHADFAAGYFLQVQGLFDPARFEVADAGGASVETSRGVTTVSGFVMPGESGAWHLRGRAEDFQSYGWQLSAMRISADVDLRDYDLSQLTDAAGKLSGATSQLAGGGAALTTALGELAGGAHQLDTLAAGVSLGADGMAGGLAQLKTGAGVMAGGIDQLAQMSGTLAGTQQTMAQLQDGLVGVRDALASLREHVGEDSELAGLMARAGQDGDALAADLAQLDAQIAAIDATFGTAGDQAGAAATSAQAAADGAAAAQDALQELVQTHDLAADDADVAALASALADTQANARAAATSATDAATTIAAGREAYAALVSGIDRGKVQVLLGDVNALMTELDALSHAGEGTLAGIDSSLGTADGMATDAQAGIAQLQEVAHAVLAGADQASDGATELAGYASLLSQGTDALATGSDQLVSGAGTLQGGLDALAATFDGLDQRVIDEAQATIDEKLGADWHPHSFIDEKNADVSAVTFVLVVDGIR